jgi:outer membrane protein assembly factor BamA
LLLEKNLPGRVDYMRMAPMDGGDIQALNFTVQDVKITIQGVKFLGPASGEETLLVEASKKLLGTGYVRDQVVAFGEKEWLPVYLQRGYLKAHFGDAVPRVIHQEGTSTVVELSVPVQPGPVYQVEEVSWTGNKVLPAQKLDSMIHLPVGEAANAIRRKGDLEAAEKPMGRRDICGLESSEAALTM